MLTFQGDLIVFIVNNCFVFFFPRPALFSWAHSEGGTQRGGSIQEEIEGWIKPCSSEQRGGSTHTGNGGDLRAPGGTEGS